MIGNFYQPGGSVVPIGTRVFVTKIAIDAFLETSIRAHQKQRIVGNNIDPQTHLGALISAATAQRYWY